MKIIISKILLLIFCLFSILTFNSSIAFQVKDTLKNPQNQILIDTSKLNAKTEQLRDTVINLEKIYENSSKDVLSNTKLFIYIILTIGGFLLFFWIFVKTLFNTLHKLHSTRQAMLISWNSFFVVFIIWVFLIWGVLGKFWSSETFLIIIVFLFIISLITFLISFKSK